MSDYVISADRSRIDRSYVIRALLSTYWAGDRRPEVIAESIERSLCFGVFEQVSGRQVGFARVVTDGCTFSWLCDVIVDPAHRGKGLGKRLVEAVLAHPEISRAPVTLGTRDAHGLYEKYGFVRWEHMRRPLAPIQVPAQTAGSVTPAAGTLGAPPPSGAHR